MWNAALGRQWWGQWVMVGSGQLCLEGPCARGHSALAVDGCRQVHFGWGGLTSACVEVTPHLLSSVAVKGRGRGMGWEGDGGLVAGCAVGSSENFQAHGVAIGAVGKALWVVGTLPRAGVPSSPGSCEADSEVSVPPGRVLK